MPDVLLYIAQYLHAFNIHNTLWKQYIPDKASTVTFHSHHTSATRFKTKISPKKGCLRKNTSLSNLSSIQEPSCCQNRSVVSVTRPNLEPTNLAPNRNAEKGITIFKHMEIWTTWLPFRGRHLEMNVTRQLYNLSVYDIFTISTPGLLWNIQINHGRFRYHTAWLSKRLREISRFFSKSESNIYLAHSQRSSWQSDLVKAMVRYQTGTKRPIEPILTYGNSLPSPTGRIISNIWRVPYK